MCVICYSKRVLKSCGSDKKTRIKERYMTKKTLLQAYKGVMRDKRLSNDEIGFLLRLHDNDDRKWRISYKNLVKLFNYSKRTLINIVNHLKQLGYIYIDKSSKWSSVWIIMLLPHSENDLLAKKSGLTKVFASNGKSIDRVLKELGLFDESKKAPKQEKKESENNENEDN